MAEAPVVVAVASDQLQAQIWVDELRRDGILASAFEQSAGAAMGGAVPPLAAYPVMVSRESFERARNVIAGLGGAGALSPLKEPAEGRRRRREALAGIGLLLAAAITVALAARAALF